MTRGSMRPGALLLLALCAWLAPADVAADPGQISRDGEKVRALAAELQVWPKLLCHW